MQASQQPRDENILILIFFFKKSEIQLWGDSPYLANITVS